MSVVQAWVLVLFYGGHFVAQIDGFTTADACLKAARAFEQRAWVYCVRPASGEVVRP